MERSFALRGILLALAGSVLLSVNDMAVKFLSGGYPLHQVVLVRSLIGMAIIVALILRAGRPALFTTRKPGLHALRTGFVVLSNITYFLGLAVLPLADGVAIFFVAPLLITALSVPILGEVVGPRRWAAVAAGLVGVAVMMRPGAGAIQPAALLVFASAFCYAMMHMLTRRMGGTESVLTMSFYTQSGLIAVSLAMGLVAGDGHLARDAGPALSFLLRAWVWPPAADWPAFLAAGLAVSIGGMMVSQAYRLCPAALIAPFEYASIPLAIFWGVVIFGQWPDGAAWTGIALICGAGLYTLWRETVTRTPRHAPRSSGL